MKIIKFKKTKFTLFFRLINKFYSYFSNLRNYIVTNVMFLKIDIGNGNKLDANIIINEPQNIKIGHNNFIGRNVHLIGHGYISIGNNCAIAADCKFISRNHLFSDRNITIYAQGYELKPINIGDDVWFGYNVIVLPGVTLGSGCVVAAGSIVTKSFPDYSIISGVPAKQIGKR